MHILFHFSSTNTLHKELAFACLMLDNIELEELESKRSTSNRFQRKFLDKVIREYIVSRDCQYRWDCLDEDRYVYH